MEVIDALVELVGDNKTKVNLTAPRSVLMIEVFRNTCGFSVLTDFHRFKKYNVRSIIDPPVPGQQTAKQTIKDGKTEMKDDTVNTNDVAIEEKDKDNTRTKQKSDKPTEEALKE
ncbi:unnamed protein product [Peronospora destructor]|uniref:THUMP domain-containing protein n=1 Tax=Peronospora destructor TaxID=86335 RepID=A0AAV0VDN8_9STRA|nr:unnamed protein product [Peronospora destructor]